MTDYFPPAFDANGREYDARVVTPPTDQPPYPHASDCRRRDSDPGWELADLATRTWKRGPCADRPSCSLVQYHDPRSAVPLPPRPSDDDTALVAFREIHGTAHVTLELVALDGDVFPHWAAHCEPCRQWHRWRHESSEHYRAHGLTLWGSTSTPLGPLTLGQLVGEV